MRRLWPQKRGPSRVRLMMEAADFCDTLQLGVGAGMSLQTAFDQSASRLSDVSALRAHCRRVARQMTLGLSFSEALEAASRSEAPHELRAVFGSLLLGIRLGSEVSDALTALASDLRQKAVAELEEHTAKVPVRMLFPLAVFFLPVFFILLAGETTVSFFRTLLHG